jgi:DNA ligase (NAD+)
MAYEADGAVIKINDLRLAEELGLLERIPRAIAYKFLHEVTTKLLDIGVNVGRTGVLPYAVLKRWKWVVCS